MSIPYISLDQFFLFFFFALWSGKEKETEMYKKLLQKFVIAIVSVKLSTIKSKSSLDSEIDHIMFVFLFHLPLLFLLKPVPMMV